MRAAKKINSWYVVYSLLWLVFLLLQLAIFTPIRTDNTLENGNVNPPLGSLDHEDDSWEDSKTIPYFQYQHSNRPIGDAFFNKVDVYYKENNGQLKSNVDCIGRELTDPVVNKNISWMFRSCRFQTLCLNVQTHEFLVVASSTTGAGSELNNQDELALGAINPRWSGRGFNKGFHKVKWSAKHVDTATIKGYYELPSNVVMVPYHSMAAHNVGHLLWDDFYPLFTLLNMFGYTPKKHNEFQYLVLRWSAEGKLYATCEMQKKKVKICNDNLQRFLPLLGVDPDTFSTVKKADLKINPTASQGEQLKSPYVCSKQAVAGVGMLMDHGMKDHGWLLRNPESGQDAVPHNVGRGSIFHAFRNFLVGNMGYSLGVPPARKRNKVTFSTFSSHGFERSLGFENQSAVAHRALDRLGNNQQIQVQSKTMKELSLEEQIQVALESVIFVTVSGGGAVTATFLPPGSTLIVYYLEDGGYNFWDGEQGNYTYTPARLDWDLLANAAHLKVHWLPMKSMETKGGLEVLEQLMLHDLNAMELL